MTWKKYYMRIEETVLAPSKTKVTVDQLATTYVKRVTPASVWKVVCLQLVGFCLVLMKARFWNSRPFHFLPPKLSECVATCSSLPVTLSQFWRCLWQVCIILRSFDLKYMILISSSVIVISTEHKKQSWTFCRTYGIWWYFRQRYGSTLTSISSMTDCQS